MKEVSDGRESEKGGLNQDGKEENENDKRSIRREIRNWRKN